MTRKGYKVTEETKEKIRQSVKSLYKNEIYVEEHRRKTKEATIKALETPEMRKKISLGVINGYEKL